MQAGETKLRALMVAGLDGDAAAHGELLRALAPLLRTFFGRRLVGAEHDVEDLVQDTLVSVHTRRATYDRDRPFTAWFYAVARHRLIDHVRRQRVHVPIEDVEAMLVTEGFEDETSARLDVDALLAALPAKQARAIRDVHIEGLSVAEAAERRTIGQSDVKVSVHRGLKALAARLTGGRT